MTKFKDFNFKLAVIEQLMYSKSLLQPKFDVYAYMKEFYPRKVNIQMHGYKAIPGVKKIFRNLEIPEELLDQVEMLDQNYHKVYHHIIPFWSGEDDQFNITSTADLKLVPNLKQVILLYDQEQKMADAFKVKGIEASYL